MRSAKHGDSPSGYDREIRPRPSRAVSDSQPFRMMSAVNAARQRYWRLPAVAHTDDPRTAYSRIISATALTEPAIDYDAAVHLAALALNLIAAVDRAQEASPATGEPG